mgnify:CR=1 FL=1
MVASATDHAAIIESIFTAPTHRKNMIRLSRVWKPRVFVVEKTVAERTVRHAAILRLGQDTLPPVEVLSRPGA